MIRAFLWGTSAAVAGAGFLALGFLAGQPATAGGLNPPDMMTVAATDTPLDRQQVETIVREYLLANPEILLEVQQALDTKQKEEQRVAQTEIIKSAKDEIFASPHDGIIGNPSGKVTIVEFYDYNCGYCKRALDDLVKLMKSDPEVRVVLKDFPVLGPKSVEAALVAQGVKKQLKGEKFFDFHQKLLLAKGQIGKAQALAVAKDAGVNMDQLAKDMESAEARAAIEETMQIGDQLGISGTPAYVVNKDVVVGAVGFDELKARAAATK